jgi:predicted metal-dependent phosphoesterase TrpH
MPPAEAPPGAAAAPRRLRVELHCHTCHSHDSLLTPAALLAACRRRGLDRVAVTDHNTIAGALEAAALDPTRVIVGEEILTARGELLAFFVREPVPPGLSPRETINRLRAQGAFISVSHPYDRARHGWAERDLEALLPLVDALEVFNARSWSGRANRRAAALAAAAGLPGTAGSDAHTASELGRAAMELPAFEDPAGLRAALGAAAFRGRLSSPLVHLCSRYAVLRKRLGWSPPQV